MAILSISVRYEKNNNLLFSSFELSSIHLYGLKTTDKSGTAMPKETYEFYIRAAQQEIEKFLNIKIFKTIIEEKIDFYQNEYRHWGYMPVMYPVVKPFELTGYLGSIKQVTYPKEWLSTRKTNDGYTYYRRMFIVPTQSTDPLQATSVSVLYHGVLPYTNLMGFVSVPNYWDTIYCTGFDEVPYDILNWIGMVAALPILMILGDIIYGMPGMSSMSLSIDGLSQTFNSTASATYSAFSARIKEYLAAGKEIERKLKYYYKGIVCSSM